MKYKAYFKNKSKSINNVHIDKVVLYVTHLNYLLFCTYYGIMIIDNDSNDMLFYCIFSFTAIQCVISNKVTCIKEELLFLTYRQL